MDEAIVIDQISEALGISNRWVRQRAKAEAWKTVFKRVRGGLRQFFLSACLPDDVRSALFCSADRCKIDGFSGGMTAARQAEAAAEARQRALEEGLAAYNALSKEQRAVADARHGILQARDAFVCATGMAKKKGSLLFIREIQAGSISLADDVMAAVPRRAGKIALSWSTLWRWEKAYADAGRGGLADGYVSRKGTSVPEHMQQFVQAMIIDRPHVSNAMIMAGLRARFAGQHIPSGSAVRRYAASWKAANAELMLFLTNPDEWKNRKMLAFGDAAEQIVRLNQLWEFDSTPGDVMLTDGRHTLIGVIDVYSRRAKLLVSPTSKAASVAALTRRAMLDWGVPEAAKTDNGSDYVSKHMVRVFTDLEVEQVLCPPFSPEKKPHIERFFETFSHSIVELLPGYIGHSVTDRKAIEARRPFAGRLMKQGADPVEIRMSSAEFQEICDRWVTAMYHENAHSGIGGKTPAQMAREWTAPVRRIANERALDILLMEAPAGDGIRTVTKKGIQADNGYFIAPELAGHVDRDVRVLLDRTDFGTIYVFGTDGAYICQAVCPERKNIDRAEVAAKAKAVQQRVIRETAAEARKLAREAKTRFIAEEILAHREAAIANIVEMPRRHEAYTTPMLEEAARAVDEVRRREMGPQPIAISEAEEAMADRVIELSAARQKQHMPATRLETYELLVAEAENGLSLTENEERWIAEFDFYLETGKETGLLAAGFRPFAERNRAARDAVAK